MLDTFNHSRNFLTCDSSRVTVILVAAKFLCCRGIHSLEDIMPDKGPKGGKKKGTDKKAPADKGGAKKKG